MIRNNNPYTNFHELNLDYVLQYLKRMFGGRAGEVLKKDSSVDMDFSWGRLSAQDVGALPDSYTPPVESVNGKTGAVELSARDVGALPDNYSPPVESVNGKTGAVELSARDVGALPDDYTPPVISVNGKIGRVVLRAADVFALPSTYTAPVDSVNGKTGSVKLSASDVGAVPDTIDVATISDLISLLPVVSIGPVNVLTITDGANNVPIEKFIVDITPIIYGSGEPSPDNVRPIGGWTGATISHSGEDTSDPATFTVSWQDVAGTVYAGSLDVTAGILTVSSKIVDLGDLSWNYYEDGTLPYFYAALTPPPSYTASTEIANATCSAYPVVAWASRRDRSCSVFYSRANGVNIIDNTYTDVTVFKSAMEGVKLVYELANKPTYQLAPHVIKTMLGSNTLWANTGNSSAVYRADIQKYIDGRIYNVAI